MANLVSRSVEDYIDEPIKRRAEAGLPMTEFVLDAHGHVGPFPLFYSPRSDAASMVAVMDRIGVAAIAVSANLSLISDYLAGNREVAAIADRHPGRFIGYVTSNPNYPLNEIEAELARWLGGSHPWMRGIKLHPTMHNYPITGPNYRVAFEAAARYDVPILSHTWGAGPEEQLCGPALFAGVAEEYPSVRFLLGHSGGVLQGYRAAIDVARRYPNIYLETCGSFQAMGLLEYLVDEVGPDRVLYGSDNSFLAMTAELGRVAYARLTTEEKRKVLGLNAAELFHYSLPASGS